MGNFSFSMDGLVVFLFIGVFIVPTTYVILGVVAGRKVIDLTATVPIGIALSILTFLTTAALEVTNQLSPGVGPIFGALSLVTVFLPFLSAWAAGRQLPPFPQEEDDTQLETGEEVVLERGQGFFCQPTMTRKIGDDDRIRNPADGIDYVYNPFKPGRFSFPTTVYAYDWVITFQSTVDSVKVKARLVGYIQPWYRMFPFVNYLGPFIAEATGEAAINCKRSDDQCVATVINTRPDTSAKAEYSAGVVLATRTVGDTATVEATAAVSLKGNVGISGGTIGFSAGGFNLGVTLNVPNTAIDTETYNQTLEFNCGKVVLEEA